MSSNIRIERVCQFCGSHFTAKTTVTRFCGDQCAKRAYKKRKRDEKIATSKADITRHFSSSHKEVVNKEFLTVKDVSLLLNCSIRTTYRLIDNGTIKAKNLGDRLTLVKRSELDKIFE